MKEKQFKRKIKEKGYNYSTLSSENWRNWAQQSQWNPRSNGDSKREGKEGVV